jgi:flavorubredoxin
MKCVEEIRKNIYWIGSNDFTTERFENIFPLPRGVSYNSYFIDDEKTAVLDSVDSSVRDQFIENIEYLLQGRQLDYLVINHIEPDHCASLVTLVEKYPNVKMVGNAQTFRVFEQMYHYPVKDNYLFIGEGDTICLGKHTLQSFKAPMVHWPEVTVTYEQTEKILFSADAFGTFATCNGNLYADEMDYDNWVLDEARRYYVNIVGKYGQQVMMTLNKLCTLDVEIIAPLHGPLYRTPETIAMIVDKYLHWAKYIPEKNGVLIAFASIYGHTRTAANILARKLAQRGIQDIRMYDVSKTHPSFIIADAWKYSHLVLMAPTYNLNLYLPMENFIHDLQTLLFQNRKIAVVGNYSWSSAAKKAMLAHVEHFKNCELLGEAIDIKSSLCDDEECKLDTLADTIAESVKIAPDPKEAIK